MRDESIRSFRSWLFVWMDYLEYSPYSIYTLFASLVVAICVLYSRIRDISLLAYTYLSGLLLHTYFIFSINPIVLVQRPLSRYMTALYLMGSLMCIIFLLRTIHIKIAKGSNRFGISEQPTFIHFKKIGKLVILLMFCCSLFVHTTRFRREIQREGAGEAYFLGPGGHNSIGGVLEDSKYIPEILQNRKKFGLLINRGGEGTLRRVLNRMVSLYGNADDKLLYPGESFDSFLDYKFTQYSTNQGMLYVFGDGLSEDLPVALTATFFQRRFVRRHPVVLQLLDKMYYNKRD